MYKIPRCLFMKNQQNRKIPQMKLIFAIIYFNQTTICRARLSPNQKKKKIEIQI